MALQQRYTIIQADGLYPDETVENQTFAPSASQRYELKYLQTNLWPTGVPDPKPWDTVPEQLRKEVDGIMVLKLPFTEQDLSLFPNLKV